MPEQPHDGPKPPIRRDGIPERNVTGEEARREPRPKGDPRAEVRPTTVHYNKRNGQYKPERKN